MEATVTVRLCTLVLLCNLELCEGTKSYFCFAKNNQQLWNICLLSIKIDRNKLDRNAPIKDTEMKARIRGVQSMMTTFNFYFGCTLGEQLLRQTDNLSRALQDSSTSAAQGNRLAQDVVKTLLKDRTDTSFSLFWARIYRDSDHWGS